ncbi:MAG TPA: winged helix-turn-helix domain-containing protein [archaeon]|nr:winged helix-turn-helix domain-containing protein [archaeon]
MVEISLSRAEFKALSSQTRTKILKMLEQRKYTLSELSTKTGMAAPTVKQHTTILKECGLIELLDEGRKWKYYSLTKKGKELLNTNTNSNILIVLGATGLFALIGIALIFTNMQMQLGSSAIGEYTPAMQKNPAEDLQMDSQIVSTPSSAGIATATPPCVPNFEGNEEYISENVKESIPYAQLCAAIGTEQECEDADVYDEANSKPGRDGKLDCKWEEKRSIR